MLLSFWSANTDESALTSSLASLDNCNSLLHWRLGFWTFLVALGVVLEVLFVAWEYLDELHDFRRGIIHAPERPQTTLFVLGLFGASLVAAGVSGEFWKESQIAAVETCIRKDNDALFLLLSKETGDAKTSAEGAATAARRAKELADAVAVTASQARAWVLHLRPRYASMDRKRFVETLNGAPPEKVEVLYERENEEAYTFAFAIALALGSGNGNAGWSVSGPRPVTEEDALPHLYAHPKNVPLIMRAGGEGGCGIIAKSVPAALREALANTGVLTQIRGQEEPNMPDGIVRIVIGKQWN